MTRSEHLFTPDRVAARPRAPRSFTLTELLVAIGIIAVIGAITVVSVRAVARNTKLASAQNTVIAALDTARGRAIRDNKLTLVAFRARTDGTSQYIEAVTAQWTGESYLVGLYEGEGNQTPAVIDRFVPVVGIAARRLPAGIMVAGPLFGGEQDTSWVATTDLRGVRRGEAAGAIIAVMYGPDGSVRMRNSQSDSSRTFVDFNRDGFQRRWCGNSFTDYPNVGNGDSNYPYSVDNNADCMCDFGQGWVPNPPPQPGHSLQPLRQFFCQRIDDDEPYLTMAPYLSVFDYEEARELGQPDTWIGNGQNRVNDLTAYISGDDEDFGGGAPRIHFNRYTGVVLR